MKVSKYTFPINIDSKEFYLYSTLSNALIEIDEESFDEIKNCQENFLDISSEIVGQELYDTLVFKKFIIENDLDNFLTYKSIIHAYRLDDSAIHITIAPTMDCCFKCHYCFEKYKDKTYISEKVMDSIVAYLNSLKNRPDIKLTWFGGEPLMALPQIESLYDKLESSYKKPISSDIITTGYHIDEHALESLERVGITNMQITLDGLKERHNAVKYVNGCDDVFEKTLINAEKVLSNSDIHITFRVNLTKQNAAEYVELYHYLANRFYKYKNIGVAPAFVMDRGVSYSNDIVPDSFFDNKDRAEFILNLFNEHKIVSPLIRYPSNFFSECAMRNLYTISFDPEGYAYKCWEVIGDKKFAIGRLDEDGRLTQINEKIINRHLFGADPLESTSCSECRYLPLCCGGCPIKRINNTFGNEHANLCTCYKGHLEEFIKIHILLKKAGIENYAN